VWLFLEGGEGMKVICYECKEMEDNSKCVIDWQKGGWICKKCLRDIKYGKKKKPKK
jgi:hypothetical protein